MNDESQPLFQMDDGTPVPSVSISELRSALQRCWNDYHIHPLQSIEAASYSHAMVVRFALGLSAQGGMVCAIVSDSIAGAVALGCLRHLTNAGSAGIVLLLEKEEALSEDGHLFSPLQTAKKLGTEVVEIRSKEDIDERSGVIDACHNILFGVKDLQSEKEIDPPLMNHLVNFLNEKSTPVHAILKPYGVPDEGEQPEGELLFASSTLSFGAPLTTVGVFPDNIGRHYISDVSLPASLYVELSQEFPYLFSDQPVVKIGPYTPTEEGEDSSTE